MGEVAIIWLIIGMFGFISMVLIGAVSFGLPKIKRD